MFPLLAVLFIAVPLVEIYVLIQVGEVIGALPTVGLVVLTALLGAALLRQQGLSTLARIQNRLNTGELPAEEVVSGALLLLSGALLLTPGFVTDTLGFLGLVPGLRHRLARVALGRMAVTIQAARSASADPRRPEGRVLEGEWRRDDP